jgi:hypothetical protein
LNTLLLKESLLGQTDPNGEEGQLVAWTRRYIVGWDEATCVGLSSASETRTGESDV